jgi:hemerythrin-like domain-containing protein
MPPFSGIPEPPPASQPPLEAMLACNQRLLRHCASLRRLVLYLAGCGCDVQAQEAIKALLHFFDQVLPLHHADEEHALFPALIESMAGSDAVCLHEITEGLAVQHHELQRQWLLLRPALQDVAAGRSGSLSVRQVEALLQRCQACAAIEGDELLPMAQRLLTQGQLEAIAAAMQQRRAAAIGG